MNDTWLARFINEALPLIEKTIHPEKVIFSVLVLRDALLRNLISMS
ncbi:MAG: hypothetical protein ACYC9O_04595 [Candidatus Latescibacterota bacterium]